MQISICMYGLVPIERGHSIMIACRHRCASNCEYDAIHAQITCVLTKPLQPYANGNNGAVHWNYCMKVVHTQCFGERHSTNGNNTVCVVKYGVLSNSFVRLCAVCVSVIFMPFFLTLDFNIGRRISRCSL